MKAKKLAYSLMTVLTLFLCALMAFTAVACTDDVVTEGPESGVYYYDSPEGEQLITLTEGNKFAFMVMGDNKTGTYGLEGETLSLTLNDEKTPFVTANLKDGVITLSYKQTEMRFVKKVPFTVTFNTNGGSEIQSVTVINGKFLAKPSDPVRAGHAFLGWYADEGLNTPFAFDSEKITADTTVFAKWGKLEVGQSEYTISFDLNYEGSEEQASVKTLGGKLYSVPAPVRSGYTFNGWWISSSNRANELTYQYTDDVVFEENTTLFALWNSEGATKLPSPAVNVSADSVRWPSVTSASSYAIEITGPEGYSFQPTTLSVTSVNPQFTVAGDYTVKVTALASSESNNSEPAIRVYRHKALKRVSLFEVAEPSVLLFNAVEHAENYYVTVECGNPNHVHTELANGSSTNYNFANCTMQKGGIKFTVKATAAGYADSVSEVFVYERNLNKIEEVTFDGDAQTLLWNSVPNASYYTVTVKCKNEGHEHEYSFNAGNATKLSLKQLAPCESGFEASVVPVTKGYNSPEAATVSFTKTSLAAPDDIRVNGFTVSWNDVGSTSYEVMVSGQKFTVEGLSIDLSAAKDSNGEGVNWTKAQYYTLSVRAADGAGSLFSDEQDIRHLAMFANLSYTGSVLSWGHVVGATSYEVMVNDNDPFTVEGGVNYAEIELDRAGLNTLSVRFYDPAETSDSWVSIQVFAYTVTFDYRGGSGDSTVLYKAAGDRNNLPVPERVGHDFAGWYNVPGGAEANGAEYTDEFFAESRDLQLYAYYEPREFEVSLKHSSASDAVDTVVKVKYGRSFSLPVPVPKDDTVVFDGWYTGENGGGTRLTDNSGKSVVFWPFAEDTVVYGFWTDPSLSFERTTVDGTNGYAVFRSDKSTKHTVINIPQTYMGEPVIRVADNAFGDSYACRDFIEINIPDTILLISLVNTFNGCTSLEKVNIVPVEGNNRVRYASDDGVLLDYGRIDDKSALADLIYVPQAKRGAYSVSDKVKTITSAVFKDSKITSISISSNVTHIGNGAFEDSSLREVTFLDALATSPSLEIAARAFLNCKELTHITLPARLETLSLARYAYDRSESVTDSLDIKEVTDAFYGCDALAEINVVDGNKNFSAQDGVLYNANKSTLLYFPAAKSGEFRIPSGVSTVNSGAFFRCNQITSVIVTGSVTSVGECAFYNCAALESVTFGGQFGSRGMSIGKFAFRECPKLSNLVFDKEDQQTGTFRSNVTSIGEGAFYNCASLREVSLPDTLTSVGEDAFRRCANLVKLTFEEENEEKIEEKDLKLSLGDNIYSDCRRLESVKLSKYIINIPLFSGCDVLNDISVSSGHPTFAGMGRDPIFSNGGKDLISYPMLGAPVYEVKSGVERISASAFRARKNLTHITISNTVTEIGADAFADCSNLEEVVFEPGETPLTIAAGAFRNCSSLSRFTVPARTVTLGENAFNLSYRNEREETLFNATGFEFVEFEDGIKLETIGAGAFVGAHFTHIEIPATVKTIEDSAFYATSLESVGFADNTVLETIGTAAFAGQSSMVRDYRKSMLKQIIIPKTVTTIRPSAFMYCESLTNITFEAGGEKELAIGDPYQASLTESHERGHVFYDCGALESIELPARTVRLGYGSFVYCTALKSVSFAEEGAQSKLQFIDESAFENSGLESIVIPKSVGNKPAESLYLGGVVTPYNRPAVGAKAFAGCLALESVVFEDGGQNPVTIGESAFIGNEYSSSVSIALKSIVLPSTLDEYVNGIDVTVPAIPAGLFGTCAYLESITVNGENKFYATYGGVLYNADFTQILVCPKGKTGELDLHDNITKLNSETFTGCSKIISIVIPGTIADINNTMLVSLTGLKEIKIKGDNALYKSENGVLYSVDGKTLISVPINYGEQFTVPEGVTALGDSAFRSCKITSIHISASVETIGESLFRDCRSLETVTFADGCKISVIPDYTFTNCSSLKAVRIPAAVTEISSKIDPDNSYSSTYTPFNGCTSLKSITFESGSQLTKIGDACFMNLESLESIVLPDSLTEFGVKAFWYCKGLTTINIPAGVLELSDSLFYYCENLTSVTFAENSELNKISNSAFYLCSKLASIVIPEEVTEIGAQAFGACRSLTELTFAGNNVEKIGEKAFANCSFKQFTVPEKVTTLAEGLFWYCEGLEQVTFHDNVTSIGEMAFIGCTSLTSITLPESITSLGGSCFSKTGLTSFKLPSKVVEVPSSLLSDCTNLTEVILHDSVTSIGYSAFENTGLTTFEVPAMISGINSSAFVGTNIEEYTVSSANTSFITKDGVLFSADGKNLISMPTAKTGSYTVPANTTVMSDAFRGSRLSEITLSSGVKMESSAFSGSSVKKLTIQSSLTISANAFSGCRLLEEIVFGPRIITLTIERNAFRNCSSLKSFTLNNRNTALNIGSRAFEGCVSLESVNITANSVTIGEEAFAGGFSTPFSAKSVTLTALDGDVTVGDRAFNYCAYLESLVISAEKGKVTIGAQAFMCEYYQDCGPKIEALRTAKGLTQQELANQLGVTLQDVVGWETLSDATSLELDNLASLFGVTVAHFYTLSLKSIEITGIDIDISGYAFRNMLSLNSVTLTAVNSVTLGTNSFFNCGFSDMTIKATAENSFIELGNSALSSCGKLSALTLEASDVTLGLYSLGYVNSLESIVLTGDYHVEVDAFNGWNSEQTIYVTISENEVKYTDWSENWLEGCAANVVYDYVPEAQS